MATKTLDDKLGRIRSGQYRPADFIIADAKDGDMSNGAKTAGPALDDKGEATGRMRPISDYRAGMREMIASGLIDIMLTSVSSAESLQSERAFEATGVTPAVRLNDATDIWGCRGSTYKAEPARPFRTARLDRARAVADLGLYAVTFYNDVDRDVDTLNAYARFRDEAAAAGMRHFLEVFNPAVEVTLADKTPFGYFMNDAIARCLAGVARADRPLFLKMPYNGAGPMEELASFDPQNLIVGILGGAAGTTRDTFELVSRAERHGARVALFGRKIWNAESSAQIVRCMRLVVERQASPGEAVKAYHDALARDGIRARRSLAEDSEITEPLLRAEA